MNASIRASRRCSPDEQRALLVFLVALAGREPRSALLEVRHRRQRGGMGQAFFAASRPVAAATVIIERGARSDVYVGAAPRRRRTGDKTAIRRAWALWADCDTPQATEALAAFESAPAIVVRSGTGENRHAYWLLREPLGVAEVEHANRRLAHALGADTGAVTNAAAILRPPCTHNFKGPGPVPVTLERLERQRLPAREITAGLPDSPHPASASGATARAGLDGDDPLRAIAPAVYVQALTGQAVPQRGEPKVSCPFHCDTTPSLHVYATAERGWFCFGCRRGTSIYDLASPHWGLDTRGRDFIELRRRLYHLLLPEQQPPTTPPQPHR